MLSQKKEGEKVKKLFEKLRERMRSPLSFPQTGRVDAPSVQAVYIIRKGKDILHVGRTRYGKGGIRQRLKNHPYGQSSFTKKCLEGNGSALRKGHTYQYLELKDARLRALLEAYAIGMLCPKHIGLGNKKKKDS